MGKSNDLTESTMFKSSKTNKNSKKNSSSNETVKSEAVVKFSSAVVPAPFMILQNNTNLNLPPPNWLSNSAKMYGVPDTIIKTSGITSFKMAHKFPDCVGVVDVVSDAENVKKLLKMAFSSSPISLLVHRVENTLLIDDFDVRKALLTTENRLYRKFFEHVMQSMQVKPQNFVEFNDKSRSSLQGKSLISKFLYHSLVPKDQESKIEEVLKTDPNVVVPLPFKESEPNLPDPKFEEELPDPASSHNFSRNVVWTFEDIQMLLGTDLPIFGGGTHPCISLKLRDMNKPINVLTGMDYWLDNLMCNVPEVVMCYHLDGIVQRYELVKTEDLPHMPDSKFSPQVVRDIAQNILSFLKSNATQAGHTYWLFKGKNDDFVKLYDLTCLCGDVLEGGQTPFTVPVAMLLYRVARNMKNQDGDSQAATVSALLKNCIALLPEDKYPEIATSVHYMLSDIYLPSNTNPQHPHLVAGSETTNSDASFPSSNDYGAMFSMSLASIREPQDDPVDTSTPPPPPLSSDVIVRCTDALNSVLKGLRSLKKVTVVEPERANPSEAIPMPSGIVSQKEIKVSPKKSDQVSTSVLLPKSPNSAVKCDNKLSWDQQLQVLLFEKAALAYLTLLEYFYDKKKFGQTLRYCVMAGEVLKALNGKLSQWEGALYAKAGDSLLMIVTQAMKELVEHSREFETYSDLDLDIKQLLDIGNGNQNVSPLPTSLDNIENLLLSSAACYNRAISVEIKEVQKLCFYRLLGNVENELGVYYMNQINTSKQELIADLLNASETHLNLAINAFSFANDKINLPLLYSNTGRLMRLRAHFSADENGVAKEERQFYNKAIFNYLKAIEVIGDRSNSPAIWDTVYWELSSTYFSLATFLQDYPTNKKSRVELERELTDILHKSLKYCDLETPSSKLPIYQFRAAKIQHRLASLHHSQYRYSNDKGRKKYILQLSELHYEKSARLMQQLEYPTEILNIQMERIGLTEYVEKETTNVAKKTKLFKNALKLMIEILPTLDILVGEEEKTVNDSNLDAEDKSDVEQQIKVLTLMIKRLQSILLSLIQLLGKKKNNEETDSIMVTLKQIYEISLRCETKDGGVKELSCGLKSVLSPLQKLLNSIPGT